MLSLIVDFISQEAWLRLLRQMRLSALSSALPVIALSLLQQDKVVVTVARTGITCSCKQMATTATASVCWEPLGNHFPGSCCIDLVPRSS